MRDNKFFFIIALWGAKITQFAVKISGKNVPYYPGYIAMKICPAFLSYYAFNNPIVAVTGTNGKSTVSSMLVSCFKKCGYKKIINNKGFNTIVGLCSCMIKSTSFFGKFDYDIAVLEVDEKTSPKIFAYIKPDYVLCTNIFRDSIKNNAHSDYIIEILSNGIPRDSVLILNADDALCTKLGDGRDALYYGVERFSGDSYLSKNIVCDMIYCPKCGHRIIYDAVRYNHIGKFHCPECGFASHAADYCAVDINANGGNMIVRGKDGDETYDIVSDNLFNIYNMLSCIALLKTFGCAYETIKEAFKGLTIDNTRFTAETVQGINVITHMAKGMNPVACSRAFEYVKLFEGEKAVILVIDDIMDNRVSSEMICWIYDADFEFLNDKSIVQIIIGGKRCEDIKLRMLVAGIDPSKITTVEQEKCTVNKLVLEGLDTVFVLYEVFAYELSVVLKKAVVQKIKAEML